MLDATVDDVVEFAIFDSFNIADALDSNSDNTMGGAFTLGGNLNVGVSTLTSSLVPSNIYGLRIEDREISLNVPDVVKIIAIYESKTTSTPELDKLMMNDIFKTELFENICTLYTK